MRDKVYIVWRELYPGAREEVIVAVCHSAKDAERHIEDLVEAEAEGPRTHLTREDHELIVGKRKDRLRQCLYITDHKVLGCA